MIRSVVLVLHNVTTIPFRDCNKYKTRYPDKLDAIHFLVGHVYRLCEIDSNVLCDVSDEFNSLRDDWTKSNKRE